MSLFVGTLRDFRRDEACEFNVVRQFNDAADGHRPKDLGEVQVRPGFDCADQAAWLSNHFPAGEMLPKRQVKRHRGIRTGCKAIVFIERLGRGIFGVDHQRKRGNLLARFQAARYSETDKQPAQS